MQRTRRIDPDAAIGLLLVAALAIGVVLASDVYHSGAGVDRLLFGSLIALTPLDLWLTAAAAVAALVCDAALRRSWLATRLRPRRRALRRRARRRSPTGCCCSRVAVAVVVALDAVGALLVTVVLIVPAATVRLFEPPLRTQQLATFALAAVEGLVAIVIADSFNVGPGPALAVLGAARLRRRRASSRRAGRRRWRRERARHHARPARRLRARRDVLGGVEFAVAAGEIAAVLGPNGGGKTTLFRALLGELPFRTGEVELAGRPAYVPQTEGARLDFPVCAHDVALMGAYGRTPWFKRVARGDRAQGRRGARAASGSPSTRTRASGR